MHGAFLARFLRSRCMQVGAIDEPKLKGCKYNNVCNIIDINIIFLYRYRVCMYFVNI